MQPDDYRILGSLGVAGGKGVVRIEDGLGNPVEDVWSALTDPARLGVWLGEVEGDLRLGGSSSRPSTTTRPRNRRSRSR